ncbi:hypothetical protein TNCV_4222271 [Trichonephila clavipes]|nr:hypothetical protein TNCV_4222271 [Trichonephila clavipes]
MANNQSVRRHLHAFTRGRIIGKLEEGRSVTMVVHEEPHPQMTGTNPPQVLQAASKWRGGVPGWSARCTSGVSTPGRATQGVKATPFCSAKACR